MILPSAASNYFTTRRPLTEPVGLAKTFRNSAIISEEHVNLLSSPNVETALANDDTPLPAPEDRENYYGDRHLEYWLSGYSDYLKIKPLLDADTATKRYLDCGGATGRVARHIAGISGVDCWLSDININYIDWINRYFTRPITAYTSTPHPTIPAEDNFFSVISAFSVFTHLDAYEMQWILEMRRTLKPGGYLYLTTMDEHVWSLLDNPDYHWLRDTISRGNLDEEFSNLVKSPLKDERFIWRYSDTDTYNINTFLHSCYVRKRWAPLFSYMDYRISSHGFQTVIILRK